MLAHFSLILRLPRHTPYDNNKKMYRFGIPDQEFLGFRASQEFLGFPPPVAGIPGNGTPLVRRSNIGYETTVLGFFPAGRAVPKQLGLGY